MAPSGGISSATMPVARFLKSVARARWSAPTCWEVVMATMWTGGRWLREDELEAGLALRLDPEELHRQGGEGGEGARGRVLGLHWFLCIDMHEECGLWLPLFSRSLGWRPQIERRGRTGAVEWTTGAWHYELRQVWHATRQAIVRAAFAGRDPSVPGRRARIHSQLVPRIWGDDRP